LHLACTFGRTALVPFAPPFARGVCQRFKLSIASTVTIEC
jgi:hypothetical protein